MKRIAVLLLHAGYWLVYGILIVLFAMVVSLTAHHQFVPRRFWFVFWHNPACIFLTLPAVMTFYMAYTLLFYRLLQTKRLFGLAIAAFGVSLLSAGITLLLYN